MDYIQLSISNITSIRCLCDRHLCLLIRDLTQASSISYELFRGKDQNKLQDNQKFKINRQIRKQPMVKFACSNSENYFKVVDKLCLMHSEFKYRFAYDNKLKQSFNTLVFSPSNLPFLDRDRNINTVGVDNEKIPTFEPPLRYIIRDVNGKYDVVKSTMKYYKELNRIKPLQYTIRFKPRWLDE